MDTNVSLLVVHSDNTILSQNYTTVSGKTPPRIMWRRRIFLIKVKISCSFSPVFLPKTKPPLYIGGQEVENNRKNCAVYLIFHDPPDRNQEFFFIATHDTVCAMPQCLRRVLTPHRQNPCRHIYIIANDQISQDGNTNTPRSVSGSV